MDCRHLEDGYEIFLLGALDRGEHDQVYEHVRQGCPYCRDELREAAENLYWFLQNVAPVQPSAAMKERLLQRLAPNVVSAARPKKPRPTVLGQARSRSLPDRGAERTCN